MADPEAARGERLSDAEERGAPITKQRPHIAPALQFLEPHSRALTSDVSRFRPDAPAAAQFVAMAAASACVMSSVVAAGSVASSAAAAPRTSASYNVLLSSHRASFKTGVAIPAAARSSASRAGMILIHLP
jgi:hypothetical protein